MRTRTCWKSSESPLGQTRQLGSLHWPKWTREAHGRRGCLWRRARVDKDQCYYYRHCSYDASDNRPEECPPSLHRSSEAIVPKSRQLSTNFCGSADATTSGRSHPLGPGTCSAACRRFESRQERQERHHLAQSQTLARAAARGWPCRCRADPTMTATLVVTNSYQWIGNPAAAGFSVYLDGRKIGVASPGRSLTAQVQPGPHTLRVRLRYFLSPKLAIDAAPGQTLRLSADRPRGKGWRRQLRGLVDPFHWLWLEQVECS